MAFNAWLAASLVLQLLVSVVNGSHSSDVPEGYKYVGHSSQTGNSNQGAGADKQHETLMFTHEGYQYTKELVLPNSAKPTGDSAVPMSPTNMPKSNKRSLLQTVDTSLACAGCPSTDTRVRVNDTKQYPWTAIGALTTNQSRGAGGTEVERVVCSGTLIGKQHVLTAAYCLLDLDSGVEISQMQYWPARNSANATFPPINVIQVRVLSIFAAAAAAAAANTSSSYDIARSLNYNFALLTLQHPAPCGTAKLAIEAGVGNQTYNLTTAGYPGAERFEFGHMWTTNCSDQHINFESAATEGYLDSENIFFHSCVTDESQRGSSMWSGENNRYIRAIVTDQVVLENGTLVNLGIKLNTFVYNTISGWYNEDIFGHRGLAPAPGPTVHSTTNGWDSEDETDELCGSPALAPAFAPASAAAP